MTIRIRLIALALVLAATGITAVPARAATSSSSLTRNAWIPYWRLDTGIAEARGNLDKLTSVSAFGYEVGTDGKIRDRIGMDREPWADFMADAKDANVKVYATVTWFDGAAIDRTLGSSRSRKKHVSDIMRIISANKQLDGIEIDYEGKLADTKDDFSLFLRDLGRKLRAKKKTLVCDIEARTPLQDRFGAGVPIPASASMYANDYAAIGSACDEVRIMAYDQGLADVTLVRGGSRPYAPVSDPAWAAKVMNVAAAEIPREKLVMGIPTYGAVYRIDENGGYAKISSITYPDAIALARRQGVTPTRNRSGELAFSYRALVSGLPGNATPTGRMNTYFVTFADATSIGGLVDLAKRQNLAGVSLFKLDGSTDPAFWQTFLR